MGYSVNKMNRKVKTHHLIYYQETWRSRRSSNLGKTESSVEPRNVKVTNLAYLYSLVKWACPVTDFWKTSLSAEEHM